MEKEKINTIYLKSLLRTNKHLFKKTERIFSLNILTHKGWKLYQYADSLDKFFSMLSNAIVNRHNFIIYTLKNRQPLDFNNYIYENYLDIHDEDDRNGKFVFYLLIALESGSPVEYTFTHIENLLEILDILINENIYFSVDAQFLEDK